MMEVTNNDSALKEGGGSASSYYGDGMTSSCSAWKLHELITKHKSRMFDGFEYHYSENSAPNAFRRFWYWALLGWTWESLE